MKVQVHAQEMKLNVGQRHFLAGCSNHNLHFVEDPAFDEASAPSWNHSCFLEPFDEKGSHHKEVDNESFEMDMVPAADNHTMLFGEDGFGDPIEVDQWFHEVDIPAD